MTPDPDAGFTARAQISFFLGGVRSGKSAFALERCEGIARERKLVFVATAQPRDREMERRIARHQQHRGPAWETIDEPLRIAQRLESECDPSRLVLVDCLTLWLSNLLEEQLEVEHKIHDLLATLEILRGDVAFVSNEVGLGIVPANALARRFTDLAGELNAQIAAAASEVWWLSAGLPRRIKP